MKTIKQVALECGNNDQIMMILKKKSEMGSSAMFLKCLSCCDLNLSTEQEDIIRICLGNLLNILIARHLKLL